MRERFTSLPMCSCAAITRPVMLNGGSAAGFNIKMDDSDRRGVLREGTCDYLSFSYYMTNARGQSRRR